MSRFTRELTSTSRSTVDRPLATDWRNESSHASSRRPAGADSRNGASSFARVGEYANGNVCAYGSTKKSNGLITVSSAARLTTTSRRSVGAGNTTRAIQLPYGSCCQLVKCSAGSIESA
jgi:hypothetical protein